MNFHAPDQNFPYFNYLLNKSKPPPPPPSPPSPMTSAVSSTSLWTLPTKSAHSPPHMAPDPSPPSPPKSSYTSQETLGPNLNSDQNPDQGSSSVMDLSDVYISSTATITNERKPQNPDLVITRHGELSLPPPSLLHLSFNQDRGCFTAGTSSGFRIYNSDPLREIFRRDFTSSSSTGTSLVGGGIGVVQMLFRCNILALVGGGADPQYALNKVMIWDDHQGRCIGELSFRSEVKSVRLRRDRIVVILSQKIFVYNFSDLKLLHQIDTVLNPKGLCEVSHVSGLMVLACPGLQKGQVRVEHYASKKTKYITAHDSRVSSLALTNDGRFLATSSSKGTLVRVFNTFDGSLLQEVRRGADRAEIYSLAFSSSAQWLAVSSDKGTVHVFRLKIDSLSLGSEGSHSPSETNSPASSPSAMPNLSFIRGVLPKYFNSEWSFAQFRLVEGLQHIVAFGHQKNTIIILGMDGSFYRCEFDPIAGGEIIQLEHHNFLKPDESF